MFLIVGTMWGAGIAAQAIVPGWSLSCSDERGCRQEVDLVGLLPNGERAALSNDPAAHARFAGYAARLSVRVGLAVLTLFDEGFLVSCSQPSC